MSSVASALRVLIKQARINSQLFSAIGILARNNDLGKEGERFVELMTAAIEKNNELVDALDDAIDKLGDERNG